MQLPLSKIIVLFTIFFECDYVGCLFSQPHILISDDVVSRHPLASWSPHAFCHVIGFHNVGKFGLVTKRWLT